MRNSLTKNWDASEYLKNHEDMVAYLDAAMEEGDPQLITAVIGDIARAKGMALVAKDTGLRRESLYKALSQDGNPEFATVMKVIKSVGIHLRASVN